MTRFAAFVLALLAMSPAQSTEPCPQGRNPMTLCKHCKDLTTVTYAFRPVGGVGCKMGCSNLCGWKPAASPEPPISLVGEPPEQPDPRRDPMRGLDPSILDDLYDAEGKYCGPIPFMKPWNYYALQVTDEQIRAVAEVAPAAAWDLVISQIGGMAIPSPLEVGDGSYTTIINAEMVKLLLGGKQDEPAFKAAAAPLEGDLGFLTRSRVDRLRNGRRLIVVETELLHTPTLSTVGIPYAPFGIEIERVPGKTVPNADQPGNPARVWRVVSWGTPTSYYGPQAGGGSSR